MKPEVMVILTNWKRPDNVVQIIDAFRAQSVPVKIVVVDNSPGEVGSASTLPQASLAKVDDVFRFTENHGPPCRFAPAYMNHECKYVLFYDDDMLPGARAVEFLLETAKSLGDYFATLGCVGRIFKHHEDGRWEYTRRNIRRWATPRMCDMTCRAHFVKSSSMGSVRKFREQAEFDAQPDRYDMRRLDAGVFRTSLLHDDLWLCLGIRASTNQSCRLLPDVPTPEHSLRLHELPAEHAFGSCRDHADIRSAMIQWASTVGWGSGVHHGPESAKPERP